MASTQGEGLHILLVIFIVLAVAAGVVAAVMYQKANKEEGLKDAAVKQLGTEKAAVKELTSTNSKMRVLVGYPEVKDEAALKMMDEEIRPYVKDRSEKTYRQALQALRERAEKAEDDFDRVSQARKKLQTEYDAAQEERAAKIAQFKKSSDEANARVTQLDSQLRTSREEFEKKNDQLAQEAQVMREKVRQMVRDTERMKKDFAFKINRKDQIIAMLREGIKRWETTDLQNPDGEVVRAVVAHDYVVVDLGSADRIRPGFPMSIYGHNEAGSPYHEPKAKVEIQQIRGPHLSVAKLVTQRPGDPVVKGDLVFSPLLNKGSWRERFALVGNFDINGDGVDDRGFLKSLIKQSDGILDAELDPDGNVKGRITVDTNWLILGIVDEEKLATAKDAEKDKLVKVLDKMAELRTEANQLNVPIINLRNFLNHMGHHSKNRLTVAGAVLD